ncbi:hypothetical protein C8A01DRAFT_15817 [Parachaetomium inaequale]|uniref:Rhodopsin domain-containing protein n=1 Tax=Parachaetomium inaequale TaxID=2588326 RepID=A0AAN6PHS9_9PEZI|nr:hypothetical protein C8A01DRAFT_15817 [Parachaetomium inaequale]
MDPNTAANTYPEDKKRQDGLIITTVVMASVAAIFVLGRCVSRFILIRNPGADDFLMVGAMLLTIGYVVNLFILRDNNLGFPITTLSLDNMVVFMKVTLAIQAMYYANVFCIKTSIVLTYLRFAVSRTFRIVCWVTIAVHSVFFAVCLIVTLAQCRPLAKMWDLVGAVEGTCINSTAFFYFTSAFNIITDIWILILPIKTLRSIQRPGRERLALFLLFGVGAFATVASIVRLHTIYIYTLATDPFRDGIPVNLWSIIEVTIAIVCGSVPGIKPLFSSRQRRATRAAKSSAGSGGSSAPGQTMTTAPRRHYRLGSHGASDKELQMQQWRAAVYGSGQAPTDSVELVGGNIGVKTDVVVRYDRD